MLQHLNYVGRHVSVKWDSTPASATHFYYVGWHVFVQCIDTSALCYDTSVTWVATSLFSIVPYLRVPIVLHPSYSLLLVYTGKHLYDKNMNNEQEESIRNQLCSVMYLQVPYVQDLCSELLWEI